MAKRAVANPLALTILAELVMGPMHPYEMGRRLTEHGKDRTVKYNRSSLYMVVEQLARAGFVAAQATVRDTQRPERTVYALTQAGRAELYDWMRELVAEPRPEYPQFGVALSLLSILPPAEAADLLDRRIDGLTREVDEARAEIAKAGAAGVPWLFVVEEDYRVAVLTTEIEFVAGLAASLREPAHVAAWEQAMKGRV